MSNVLLFVMSSWFLTSLLLCFYTSLCCRWTLNDLGKEILESQTCSSGLSMNLKQWFVNSTFSKRFSQDVFLTLDGSLWLLSPAIITEHFWFESHLSTEHWAVLRFV